MNASAFALLAILARSVSSMNTSVSRVRITFMSLDFSRSRTFITIVRLNSFSSFPVAPIAPVSFPPCPASMTTVFISDCLPWFSSSCDKLDDVFEFFRSSFHDGLVLPYSREGMNGFPPRLTICLLTQRFHSPSSSAKYLECSARNLRNIFMPDRLPTA
ncbi:hypothetical protein D3C75_980170 [compost metagenome]